MKLPTQCMATALATVLAIGTAFAQAYPTRPITIVIPNVPGSPYEAAVRLVNEGLTKRLGQPVVVEYKPGAGQLIGANYVRTAKPDGYTLLYGSVLGIHPLFVKNNAVDAEKQLSPISAYAFTPFIIFSAARLKSFQEILAYSKANPNQLKWGTTTPLVTLMYASIKQKIGITGEFIPYKGSSQLTAALASGEVDLATGTSTSVAGLVEAGKINAIFVTSSKRTAVLPNVPSAAEMGFPDLSYGFSQGLWGPLGLSSEIANKLSAEVARILKTPEANTHLLRAVGADVLGTTPEEQVRLFRAEIKGYADAAKLINFQRQ